MPNFVRVKSMSWRVVVVVLLLAVVVANVAADVNPSAVSTTEVVGVQGCTEQRMEEDVDNCLRGMGAFLYHYMRRYTRPKFDRCGIFQEDLDLCLQHWNKCPQMRSKLSDNVQRIILLMDCACTVTVDESSTGECEDTLVCMEYELTNFFAFLCTDQHEWEIQQNSTNHYCRTLNRLVRCEEGLIDSACGPEASNLYLEAQTVISLKKDRRHCKVPNGQKDEGLFRYSSQCPRDLDAKVDACVDYLTIPLVFDKANPLLVKGSAADVQANCSSFAAYMECLEAYNKSCPIGVKEIFKTNRELRSLILKMEVICSDRSEYGNNLQCFQSMQARNLWNGCSDIAVETKELLKKVQPVTYYCRPHFEEVIAFKTSLTKMRQCFHDVAKDHCSEGGGQVLSELIGVLFNDAYYLRFDYETMCDLHELDRSHYGGKPNKNKLSTARRPSNPRQEKDKAVTESAIRNSEETMAVLSNASIFQPLMHMLTAVFLGRLL